MKKLLYLFLVLPLIFSSCKKEEEKIEGCMDSGATNYNSNATEQNNASSCMYAIAGYVWETTSIVLNGANLAPSELWYFFNDGTIGSETYDASGTMIGIGVWNQTSSTPNVITLDGTSTDINGVSQDWTGTINVDIMTNATNMTWRYVNYPTAADTYVKTLVRSNAYSLSDWK
jgi:hypothetical protein